MSDLREQIATEVHHAKPLHDRCSGDDRIADAVMAVVQPEIDAKDAEIAELRAAVRPGNVELIRKLVHSYSRLVTIERDDARQRAEQAEAERDRLRARLTGVAIHAHRLANRIQPDMPAWAALTDLRAALDQPGDQEGTGT